jgi:hypothetical protein
MSKVHFMLDIETMGQDATAPVLSIAAVAFQPGVRQEDYPLFMEAVSPYHQPDRKIDFDTVKWWMSKDKAAAEHWLNAKPRGIGRVLEALKCWAEHQAGEERWWWANSPNFDMVSLEGLYREHVLDYPWNFRDLRDVRTIRAFLKDSSYPKFDFAVAHNPAHDCLAQIEWVHRFYQEQGRV